VGQTVDGGDALDGCWSPTSVNHATVNGATAPAVLDMGLIHLQILQMAQIQNKNLRKPAPSVDRGFHTENCYYGAD